MQRLTKDEKIYKNKDSLLVFTENKLYANNSYLKLCLINWYISQKLEQCIF
jgi:hypothetical protein